MLRNCKVPRVLPRIADCAKNDRSTILRARYEIQREIKIWEISYSIGIFSFIVGVVNTHY